MCNEEENEKSEFEELLDSIGQKPTSKMRDIKEGFALDLKDDSTPKKNDK